MNKLTWIDRIEMSRFRHSGLFRFLLRYFSESDTEKALRKSISYLKQRNITGDYLEFGVFKGRTFIQACHFAELYDNDMSLYAFDSFKGLPEPEKNDTGDLRFYKGAYCCSLENFTDNLDKFVLNHKKIFIIEGFYKDSLKYSHNFFDAALVYIDCDLYSSSVQALEYITDYVKKGTIIIFDDWYSYLNSSQKGQQKAFLGWILKTGIEAEPFIDLPPSLKAFIIT